MAGLSTIERLLERLFERPAARIFHSRVQPVQLQRRIERAMETERLSGADRTLVPNAFTVRLHPADLEPLRGIAASLVAELADGALAFARRHAYTVLDRPRVDLVADPAVEPGEIRVAAGWIDRAGRRDADALRAEDAPASGIEGGAASRPDDTMVFRPPTPAVPRATLRLVGPGGRERRVTVGSPSLTLGRATDNGIVVDDARVSRHHARLQARQGRLVLTDLESTNGTRVNGVRVAEVALGEGDRIELGDTTLVVESMGGD
jgi:pSer/pThr/pTyr-binding forkhead associated (FHA) protein